jgi:hypothetical protein
MGRVSGRRTGGTAQKRSRDYSRRKFVKHHAENGRFRTLPGRKPSEKRCYARPDFGLITTNPHDIDIAARIATMPRPSFSSDPDSTQPSTSARPNKPPRTWDENDPLVKRFLMLQLQVSAASDRPAQADRVLNCLCLEIGNALEAGNRQVAAAKLEGLQAALARLEAPTTESNTSVVDGELIKALLKK